MFSLGDENLAPRKNKSELQLTTNDGRRGHTGGYDIKEP